MLGFGWIFKATARHRASLDEESQYRGLVAVGNAGYDLQSVISYSERFLASMCRTESAMSSEASGATGSHPSLRFTYYIISAPTNGLAGLQKKS